MRKNIIVDYNKLLKNSVEFEKTICKIVETIPAYSNLDATGCKYYTSNSYLDSIKDSDLAISKNTNLKEFAVSCTLPLIRFLAELYPGHSIVPTGYFMYPVTGYMGWHTNSDTVGKRVYVTYVDKTGCSGFKYRCDGDVVDSVDSEKITIREFNIEKDKPLWHAVYSECNRYSFGFRVVDLR